MEEDEQKTKEITADDFIVLVVKEIINVQNNGEHIPITQARDFGTTIRIEEKDTRLYVRGGVSAEKIFKQMDLLDRNDIYYLDFVNIEFFDLFSFSNRELNNTVTFEFINCGFYRFSPNHSKRNLTINIVGGTIYHISAFNIDNTINYNSCTIEQIEINDRGLLQETQEEWVFRDVTFAQPITGAKNIRFINLKLLGNLSFFGCTFYVAPNFLGCTLNHQTIFSQCFFRDKSRESIACYRLLRSEMQRLNNEREAVMFGSLEMETYHLAEFNNKTISGSDRIEKWASTLYRRFSSYGRDVLTPFLWITLVSTFLFYGLYDWFDLTVVDIKDTHPEWISDFFQDDRRIPLIQSFWNMLGPISLLIDNDVIQPRNGWGASSFIFQKTLASVMWFLWILQIRRRFKLG